MTRRPRTGGSGLPLRREGVAANHQKPRCPRREKRPAATRASAARATPAASRRADAATASVAPGPTPMQAREASDPLAARPQHLPLGCQTAALPRAARSGSRGPHRAKGFRSSAQPSGRPGSEGDLSQNSLRLAGGRRPASRANRPCFMLSDWALFGSRPLIAPVRRNAARPAPRNDWRRVPESNRRARICNPLRNHSANSP